MHLKFFCVPRLHVLLFVATGVLILGLSFGRVAIAGIAPLKWVAYERFTGSTRGIGVTHTEACNKAREWMDANSSTNGLYYYTIDHIEPECFLIQRTVPNQSGGAAGTAIGSVSFPYAIHECPGNSMPGGDVCVCKDEYLEDKAVNACRIPKPELPAGQCKAPDGILVGQPIIPSSGEKYRSETDWSDGGPAPLSLIRTYRSGWSGDATRVDAGFGKVWTHNHALTLQAVPSAAPVAVTITSPEGYTSAFSKLPGSSVWRPTSGADALTEAGGGWMYKRAEDDAVLAFTADGKLQTRTERGGFSYAYAYDDDGRLKAVTNGFGRALLFTYQGSKLATVTLPDRRVVGYLYDSAGRLSTVIYPDRSSRGFVYENANFPQALTGILDEAGVRWASFTYDERGRARSTELAGRVNWYWMTYSGSSTVVRDPVNVERSYTYSRKGGSLVVSGASYASGEGLADAKTRVQDESGVVSSETDFKDVRTDYAWDVARRLLTSVTRAAGTPEAQTITTQWHPTMALPTVVTEVGRSTAYSWDPQGRLLTKSVTDTLVSPARTMTWAWTYDSKGLVIGEQAPNGAATTYTYDGRGNVLTSTNAVGHVTRYTWDDANRLASQTAPNGLVTTYSWDDRDRLLTIVVGGQHSTSFVYNLTGTLATLTSPTGLSLAYTYDAAHRMTGWSNNRGETGALTLDGRGDWLTQELRGGGVLAYRAARVMHYLGGTYERTAGGSRRMSYEHDSNGELTGIRDADQQEILFGRDSLRRIKTIQNATGALASIAYDGLDSVIQARDANGITTSYGRDAEGNATVESSPDSGSRVVRYDQLGLPRFIVDALGQSTNIVRDAIGRPLRFEYADGEAVTLTWDSEGAGAGYLRQIQDRSGTTVFTRDRFGRVVGKSQKLANGAVQNIANSYTAAGQVDTITYPSGGQLQHLYSSNGQLIGLNWNGAPLLKSISWNALGQPTNWTWAFAGQGSGGIDQSTVRMFNTAGELTQVQVAGQPVLSVSYGANGAVGSFGQLVSRPSRAGDTNSSVVEEFLSWSAVHDKAGRLTSLSNGPYTDPLVQSTFTYTYDANGNRTSERRTRGATVTARAYNMVNGTNRMSGFTQAVDGTSTSVAYSYNANGDLTGDGLRSYRYDATGRMVSVAEGSSDVSAVTRYAHNALGQRVFKTEPVYPAQGADGAALSAFFAKGWTPQSVSAEQVGWSYAYDDEGTLLGEYGMGGAQSAGRKQYVYLPTASGPLPVALIGDTGRWAVTADHLNTPRRVTRTDGKLEWQWILTSFGQDQPTIAARKFLPNSPTTAADFSFPLRYPGQYYDQESGLFYNYFRTYSPTTGRYTQPDPIGLEGGWNRFAYVAANPLAYSDPFGLDNPNMGPYGPGGNQGQGLSGTAQRAGAISDFIRNYNDMRAANTIGGDKYFHCKANCEATRRGPVGEATACKISDGREWTDQKFKGDPASASRADQAANAVGRSGALSSTQSCSLVCALFRPNGLPPQY